MRTYPLRRDRNPPWDHKSLKLQLSLRSHSPGCFGVWLRISQTSRPGIRAPSLPRSITRKETVPSRDLWSPQGPSALLLLESTRLQHSGPRGSELVASVSGPLALDLAADLKLHCGAEQFFWIRQPTLPPAARSKTTTSSAGLRELFLATGPQVHKSGSCYTWRVFRLRADPLNPQQPVGKLVAKE